MILINLIDCSTHKVKNMQWPILESAKFSSKYLLIINKSVISISEIVMHPLINNNNL